MKKLAFFVGEWYHGVNIILMEEGYAQIRQFFNDRGTGRRDSDVWRDAFNVDCFCYWYPKRLVTLL